MSTLFEENDQNSLVSEENGDFAPPVKKLKRLLKKSYAEESPIRELKKSYAEESPIREEGFEEDRPRKSSPDREIIEVGSQRSSDRAEENGEVEEAEEVQEVKPKKQQQRKTIKKRPKKEANNIDSKRFISVFEESDQEKGAGSGGEGPRSPVKKAKKLRKRTTRKAGNMEQESTQEPNNQENSEISSTEKKKGRRLKLTRIKKTAEITINEENPSEEYSVEIQLSVSPKSQLSKEKSPDGVLQSLKKRAKKKRVFAASPENSFGVSKLDEPAQDDGSENSQTDEKKAKKSVKNPKKQGKSKAKTESTQEIFERMRQENGLFCEEESSHSSDSTGRQDKARDLPKKRGNTLKNHVIIKTRNKFFKEINTLDFNPLLEENPAHDEDEVFENQPILLEIAKKPKKQLDVQSFLGKFQKFKEERALDVKIPGSAPSNPLMNPNNMPSNPVHNPYINEPNNDSKAPNNNNEASNQTEENIAMNNPNSVSQIDPQNPSTFPPQNNTHGHVLPRQEDFLCENPDKNSRKIPMTLKQTPQELSQFLNNTLSNFSLDNENVNTNLSLQISIPSLTKANSAIDTTLFVNKLARSNSIFNKSVLSLGGLSTKTSSGFSLKNPSVLGKAAKPLHSGAISEREIYKNRLMEEIRKRKSRNLNLENIQERFKQTDWTELTFEKSKPKKGEAKEEARNEEVEDEDDEDYNPEEEKDLERNEEAGVDFKKMIELEEGKAENGEGNDEENGEEKGEENDDEGDCEDEGEGSEGTMENEESKGNEESRAEVKNEEERSRDNDKTEVSKLEEKMVNPSIIPMDDKPEHSIPKPLPSIMEEEHQEVSLGFDQESLPALKKLRKIAEVSALNYALEHDRKPAKKPPIRTPVPSDPKARELMRKMFEMEAELGSDNEDNDDVVKKIDRGDEDERDSEEGLDEELKEMIDNITEVKEGEDELLWDKFNEDLMKQDKENLKKVLERAFRVNKRRSEGFDIGLDDRMSKRMAMIEERIKLLEESESFFQGQGEGPANPQKQAAEDLFTEREDNFIRLRELNMKIRKEVERKTARRIDESLIVDQEIAGMIEKKADKPVVVIEHGKGSKKEPPANKSAGFFRNSILQIKRDKGNNISVFTNSFNRDVMNEFGVASTKLGNDNNEEKAVKFKENEAVGKSAGNGQVSSSLNKFFSKRHAELNRPSPNKVFFFGVRK